MRKFIPMPIIFLLFTLTSIAFAHYEHFKIPTATITIDGNMDDWNDIEPVYVDDVNDEDPNANYEGTDLYKFYLAKDDTFLYLMMTLYDGAPKTEDSTTNLTTYYSVRFAQYPSFDSAGDRVTSAYHSGGNWHSAISEIETNGSWPEISSYPSKYVGVGSNFIEWKVYLSDMGTLNERYLRPFIHPNVPEESEKWPISDDNNTYIHIIDEDTTATPTPTPSPTPNDSSEVLIFSDDFERSDYTDKWKSGAGFGGSKNTITIVDGYIESTTNGNYIETLESFTGNLRVEVDVLVVGNVMVSCWDFIVTLGSPNVAGYLLFNYDGVDGINISTSYGECGDKYTMNSSGVNKGKAVLTYSGFRASFSFTNNNGDVLKTDEISASSVKSKVRIVLAGHQDSPRYIDNVKIYSLGSATASTPTPKATPTPAETGSGVIYGFVADVEGFALKKVSVTLTDSSDDYSRSTSTDTEGYYEFTGLAADEYAITYEKDGYQTQTKDISLEEDETLDLGTLKMEQTEMGSISGYVVDIRGDPVESVKLKLKGIKTKTTVIESSDADGFFEFADLTADNYVITASRKKYKTTRKTVTIEEGEAAEIEIEMRKTTKRRGILLLMRGN